MATPNDSVEMRFDCPKAVVDIIDAVSLAQRLTRGQAAVRVLSEWAEQRHREASLIARVTRINPIDAE